MAVTHRHALRIVAALGTDHVVDLLRHQLRQHAQPDTHAQRQEPLLGCARQLAQRYGTTSTLARWKEDARRRERPLQFLDAT
jgi:hypothetical protein